MSGIEAEQQKSNRLSGLEESYNEPQTSSEEANKIDSYSNLPSNASWKLVNQEDVETIGSDSIDSNVITGISPEEEMSLVVQSIVDAETYIRYASQYITLLRSGKKTKGTKLSGQVKNHRNTALVSSLTDVKYSTVA